MNSKLTLVLAAALLLAAVPAANAARSSPFYKFYQIKLLFVPQNISSHDATKADVVGSVATAHGIVVDPKNPKKQMGTYNFAGTIVGYDAKKKHALIMFDTIIELGPKGDDSLSVHGQFELSESYVGLQDATDMDAIVVGGHGKYLGAFGNFIEKRLNKPGPNVLSDLCFYVPIMKM